MSLSTRVTLVLIGLAVGLIGVALVLDSDVNLSDLNVLERDRNREAPTLTGITTAEARVTFVIDGDTVEIGSGAHVRLIGIDTPEREECGYREAAEALRTLVEGRTVTLVNPRSVQDEDVHGRLLRYVDRSGEDAGYDLFRTGLAVARYDSRDGLDPHPREKRYHAMDGRVASLCG